MPEPADAPIGPARGGSASRYRPAPVDRELLELAGVVILGAVMTVLDATAVNVAVAVLSHDLHASLSAAQWALTGYLLALALVVPFTAWATGRFGAKRLWLISLTVFIVGSALSGVSWSIGSLIAFRVLQGAGGGMIAPLSQTVLARTAGPERMGRAMSMLGVITVLGPVIGPVAGGLLVQDVGWRWIFFINVPIGAAALIAAAWRLPRDEYRTRTRLDIPGLALVTVGLVGITYGMSQAPSHGGFGDPRVWVPAAAGAVLLTGFARYGYRRGAAALIDLRLFTDRAFASASAGLFLLGMALFGALLLLPLYYQEVRGQGALGAGLLLVPQGVGVAVALRWAGTLTDRRGARFTILPGIVLVAVGTLPFVWVGTSTPFPLLEGALVIRGLGMGLVMTPLTAAAYVTLPPNALAGASSATTLIRQVGGSIGIALLAVVVASQDAHSRSRLAGAFGNAFLATLILTLLMLSCALVLPRGPVRARAAAPDMPRRPADGSPE
jgi:EmrB/QacA subfamily drug resistance transporter